MDIRAFSTAEENKVNGKGDKRDHHTYLPYIIEQMTALLSYLWRGTTPFRDHWAKWRPALDKSSTGNPRHTNLVFRRSHATVVEWTAVIPTIISLLGYQNTDTRMENEWSATAEYFTENKQIIKFDKPEQMPILPSLNQQESHWNRQTLKIQWLEWWISNLVWMC
jgi:hypothetical protein